MSPYQHKAKGLSLRDFQREITYLGLGLGEGEGDGDGEGSWEPDLTWASVA